MNSPPPSAPDIGYDRLGAERNILVNSDGVEDELRGHSKTGNAMRAHRGFHLLSDRGSVRLKGITRN